MIDDEIDRHQRIDLLRITAKFVMASRIAAKSTTRARQ